MSEESQDFDYYIKMFKLTSGEEIIGQVFSEGNELIKDIFNGGDEENFHYLTCPMKILYQLENDDVEQVVTRSVTLIPWFPNTDAYTIVELSKAHVVSMVSPSYDFAEFYDSLAIKMLQEQDEEDDNKNNEESSDSSSSSTINETIQNKKILH